MQVSISHKKAADADKIDELVRCIAERFDPDQSSFSALMRVGLRVMTAMWTC